MSRRLYSQTVAGMTFSHERFRNHPILRVAAQWTVWLFAPLAWFGQAGSTFLLFGFPVAIAHRLFDPMGYWIASGVVALLTVKFAQRFILIRVREILRRGYWDVDGLFYLIGCFLPPLTVWAFRPK